MTAFDQDIELNAYSHSHGLGISGNGGSGGGRQRSIAEGSSFTVGGVSPSSRAKSFADGSPGGSHGHRKSVSGGGGAGGGFKGTMGRFVDSFRRGDGTINDNIDLDDDNNTSSHGYSSHSVSRDHGGTRYYDLRQGNSKLNTPSSLLARELKGRHLQMIAIGGSIGTGLFVASGRALSEGGPASVLIAYLVIGIMLFCTIQALGELAVIFPVAGSFSAFSTRFLDPSWGFAMGWK